VSVVVLALDLGTTVAKAGVFVDGRLVARADRPITTDRPTTDTSEQTADSWLDGLTSAAREVVAASQGAQIEAIGLSAQSDTLVVVDERGQAVRPAMLWTDPRGASAALEVERVLGRQSIHERTGLRSSFNFTAPKAAWLRTAEPDSFRRARWIMQPKDFVHLWLTGVPATDPSSASRSLAYDLRRGTWWDDAVEAYGLPRDSLLPILPSAACAGSLTASAARRLDLPAGVPVCLGAADRASEALGLGIEGAEAMISTGTATGVAMALPPGTFVADDRIATPAHAVAGESLALLSIPTSGILIDWLASVLRSAHPSSAGALFARAARSSRGANGVVAVPTFGGARSFRWEPTAQGAFLGLGLASTPDDLARATVEGITFEIAECLDVLGVSVGPVEELRLTGGVYTNPFMCQLTTDVTNQQARRFPERDAALAGAMLLAGQAIEAWPDARAVARSRLGHGTPFHPDPYAVAAYKEPRDRYRRAVDAVLAGPRPAGEN
jgi:xylulokinase